MNDQTTTPHPAAGVLFCMILGSIIFAAAQAVGGGLATNGLAICLLVGAVFGNTLGVSKKLMPGVAFTEKKILKYAIITMGFKVSIQDLVDGDASTILVAILSCIGCLGLTYIASVTFLGVKKEEGVCLSSGCAICGSSAIMAVESLFGNINKTKLSLMIALVGFMSTLSFLTWPILFQSGFLPFLSETQFGVFMGSSVFAVPQAIAGGAAISPEAGGLATIAKLSRVLFLVPLILGLGLVTKKAEGQKASYPLFILGFVAILAINSTGILPELIVEAGQFLAKYLMYGVMVAVGCKTILSKIFTKEVFKGTFTPIILGYVFINSLAMLLSWSLV